MDTDKGSWSLIFPTNNIETVKEESGFDIEELLETFSDDINWGGLLSCVTII